MSEELEALLVERKAVKYWRTEYLRVQRERDELEAAIRAIIAEDDVIVARQDLEHPILKPLLIEYWSGRAKERQKPPQREGDYL